MFPQALQKFALEKKQEVVDIIVEKCPNELKEHMFTQTLENPDLKKDKEAVDMITEAYNQFRISKMAANPTEKEDHSNSKRREEQREPTKSNGENTKKAPKTIGVN